MNEKIKTIKDYFMENGYVNLAKQCKNEYIIYFFCANYERNAVVHQNKQHFKNRDLEGGKSKHKKVCIPFDKFFDEVIYDLLNRGYELETSTRYNNVFEYKNEKDRRALREEYIKTLPQNKQLAIWLQQNVHEEFCNNISFDYEIKGLEDDWEKPRHKYYLNKANYLLKIADIDIIKNIIYTMEYNICYKTKGPNLKNREKIVKSHNLIPIGLKCYESGGWLEGVKEVVVTNDNQYTISLFWNSLYFMNKKEAEKANRKAHKEYEEYLLGSY